MIISMSIDKELLKELDNIQEEQEYKGRSEVVRTALKMLVEDVKQKREHAGIIDAVMMVIHNEENVVNEIKHSFQNIIKTQLHSHLQNHKCLDLFVLNGEGSKIKSLKNNLQKNTKVEHVKLVVS